MTKFVEKSFAGCRGTRPLNSRCERYILPPLRTLEDVRGDIQLKRLLKRAVARDRAPQYLVNSIRQAVRG